MSKALEKARQQFQDGRDKQAVNTLDEVACAPDAPRAEIDGLLELATAIRARNGGSLQAGCDAHIDRARKRLAAAEQSAAAARLAQLRAELDEPVRLAHWAAQTGLGWLEVTSADDIVAASQSRAMAAMAAGGAAANEQCMIDLVEAEGWRLEHVVHRFVATRVQTSILRGADLLGGDAVEGDEQYFYLFRRVPTCSQG
jgi:hypothetical protein